MCRGHGHHKTGVAVRGSERAKTKAQTDTILRANASLRSRCNNCLQLTLVMAVLRSSHFSSGESTGRRRCAHGPPGAGRASFAVFETEASSVFCLPCWSQVRRGFPCGIMGRTKHGSKGVQHWRVVRWWYMPAAPTLRRVRQENAVQGQFKQIVRLQSKSLSHRTKAAAKQMAWLSRKNHLLCDCEGLSLNP